MRPIDADSLIKDIVESIRLADEWERESYENKDEIGLKYAIDTRQSLMAMLSRVKEAPTIEAEPVRHGRWIDTPLPNSRVAKCSLCGFWQRTNGDDKAGKHMIHNAVYRYCGGCGARMDGGTDNA